MAKKKYKEKIVSMKIEGARDRLYKASAPDQIAKIFFPNNDAKQKRAAFLAIMFEIRNSRNQKTHDLNHIPRKYDINKSCYFKARAKMTRLGLIAKNSGYWSFSDRFQRAWESFFGKLESIRYPAATIGEEGLERVYIENAKTEDVYFQLRKLREGE